MPEKRLFIGIPIPHALKIEIDRWQKKQIFYHNIRWTPLNNLHVTILFLGNIHEEKIPELSDKIKEIANSIEPFYLNFQNFTYFPQEDSKMIWAQFQACDPLIKLQQAIHSSLNLNNEEIPQSIIPHITLARIKSATTPLREENKKLRDMLVDNIVLWESVLESTGSKHIALKSHDLGDPAKLN